MAYVAPVTLATPPRTALTVRPSAPQGSPSPLPRASAAATARTGVQLGHALGYWAQVLLWALALCLPGVALSSISGAPWWVLPGMTAPLAALAVWWGQEPTRAPALSC